MYFADSLRYAIARHAYDVGTDMAGPGEELVRTPPPGFPDGATVDEDGYLWNAEFNGGRLVRYSPEGRVDRVVETPVGRPTSCALGGPDLRTLFVTTTCQAMSEAELEAEIMVDANQSLDLSRAETIARALAPFGLRWLEKPLRVDRPTAEWDQLAALRAVPLAGGENMRGVDLQTAAAGTVYGAIQPDITKWGGITSNWPVAQAAVASGRSFCPYVFGGGVALLTSLQLLAAAGGDGTLEFDCHSNAAREAVVGSLLPVRNGAVPVPPGAGLGAVPDIDRLDRFRTWPA